MVTEFDKSQPVFKLVEFNDSHKNDSYGMADEDEEGGG